MWSLKTIPTGIGARELTILWSLAMIGYACMIFNDFGFICFHHQAIVA
jgi:hypothetical protein